MEIEAKSERQRRQRDHASLGSISPTSAFSDTEKRGRSARVRSREMPTARIRTRATKFTSAKEVPPSAFEALGLGHRFDFQFVRAVIRLIVPMSMMQIRIVRVLVAKGLMAMPV